MPSTPGAAGGEVVRLRLRVGEGLAAGEEAAARELYAWLAGTTELTELATVDQDRQPRTPEETTPALGFEDFWYDVLVGLTPQALTLGAHVLYRLLRSRQPASERDETVTVENERGERLTLGPGPASNEEMEALGRLVDGAGDDSRTPGEDEPADGPPRERGPADTPPGGGTAAGE
jgi:hypothetical protein